MLTRNRARWEALQCRARGACGSGPLEVWEALGQERMLAALPNTGHHMQSGMWGGQGVAQGVNL